MAEATMIIQWGVWIICTVIASLAMLKAWEGWLDLKRRELDAGRTGEAESPAGRISLADLKQRVRRLEAIAEGIDIPDARPSGRR